MTLTPEVAVKNLFGGNLDFQYNLKQQEYAILKAIKRFRVLRNSIFHTFLRVQTSSEQTFLNFWEI